MDRELAVATEAARRAAAVILEIYGSADQRVRQKEQGRGPVTEADLASDRILHDLIRSAFPADGWLSEETVDDPQRLSRSRCWIVDPLDGTKEFTEGIPEFVVSVGLAIDGRPALGVLIQPVTGLTIAGIVGRGCTANGAACRTTATRGLDASRLLVSRTEMGNGWFDAMTARVEPMGSVAYKLGLVAAGLADATFTPKPRNEWDLCGGVAVVLAAGGTACDGSGQSYRFNRPDPLHIGVVGTNGPLHDAILDLTRSMA